MRSDPLPVAKRLEAALGDHQAGVLEGEPSAWACLPPPEGFFPVGLAGGYVHHGVDKQHTVEVSVGQSILRFAEGEEGRGPSLKRFGFVQTLATKATRRLSAVLHSHDVRMPQAITLLSDGDAPLRALPLAMRPQAIHILEWHPLPMKLTVWGQYGQGLGPCEAVVGAAIQGQSERLQWALWQGQGDKGLSKLDALETAGEPCGESYARCTPLVKAWSQWRTDIVHNRPGSPNDGARSRHGEALATGFVESTGNDVVSQRFCKKQQTPWSQAGAHWLLQTRVRTLTGELSAILKRGYPGMDLQGEARRVAAYSPGSPCSRSSR